MHLICPPPTLDPHTHTHTQWRPDGVGEVYTYLERKAQAADYCKIKPLSKCNGGYGDSLGRGSFTLATGSWNTIRLTIRLNTGGAQNGGLDLTVNGRPAISYQKMDWRSTGAVKLTGIDFETFFGGADSSWATPREQSSYFRNFKLTAQ